MRGAVPLGLLLILIGLTAVPLFKEAISRILLFAIFGGGLLFLVVFVLCGLYLIAFRR